MTNFRGSCHCRRVAFEIEASPTELSDCNCSLCFRKGAIYLELSASDSFRILSGESELEAYQFNTKTARHYFCRACGVHPFHRSRFAPERFSVNARCLEQFDFGAYPTATFDGENWEVAARADGWRG